MILVTFKGVHSPLVGKMRTVVHCASSSGPSVATALLEAFDRFRNERDCFLFVAAGGRVWTAPVWEYLRGRTFDVAACVDRKR